MTTQSKETQRNELHRTIWGIANDLRGSVDGWDFKSYVLGMLFYRYISENLTSYLNQHEHESAESVLTTPSWPTPTRNRAAMMWSTKRVSTFYPLSYS